MNKQIRARKTMSNPMFSNSRPNRKKEMASIPTNTVTIK